MVNGYESFDNTETSFRKDPLIQERVGLVSTHMYKQFLDFQNATINANTIFSEIIQDLKSIEDTLKKSFSSRGIPIQNNINVDYDSQKTVVTINILWHTISLTTRCNFEPKALYREGKQAMLCSRIMAVRGSYNEILKGVDDRNESMNKLLQNEVASLYVPADNMQGSLITIKHLGNKEFYLNNQDAAKEFVLKVIEIVCGGSVYHQEDAIPNFNL